VDKETINLIIAVAAALIAFLGYRNSARKGLVDELMAQVKFLKETAAERDDTFKTEIAARDVDRKKLRNRVRFLTKLLIQRESENNKQAAKISQWFKWADQMGRAYYTMQLEVLTLRKDLSIATGGSTPPGATMPLPPLPDQDALRPAGEH
jgi:hypothetical protein